MKKWLVKLFVGLLIFSSVQFSSENVVLATEPLVTVSLKQDIQNVTTLQFSLKGTYKETVSGKSLYAGKKYTVKMANDDLLLYDGSTLITKGKELAVVPTEVKISHLITLFGNAERSYLGTMNFTIEDSKYIRPLNSLPVEEYVKGVVPAEMNSSYHIHALRAQAIAARTYVLFALSKNLNNKDIDDTPSFQRYAGYSMQYNDSIKAAYETRGKVLTYNGAFIEALYSASNGGFTETNVGAWPGQQEKLPYFTAKADLYDPKEAWNPVPAFDKKQISLIGLDLRNPDHWWNSVNEKNAKLAAPIIKNMEATDESVKLLDITSFDLTNERTEGKRIKQADFGIVYMMKDSSGTVVLDENGEVKRFKGKVSITAAQLKAALNLKSTYVTAAKASTTAFRMSGLGFGHGVGMSQKGAQAMANKGLGFREILAFYYPETVIKNDKTSNIPTALTQVMGSINYEGTNIRRHPYKTLTNSITTLKFGESLTILGKSKDWFKVKVGNVIGYVQEKNVDVHQTITYKNGTTPITSGKIKDLGAPIRREGTILYVPLEQLSIRYGWKFSRPTSSSFTVVDGKKKITASTSHNTVIINGTSKKLTVRAKMMGTRVYVPVTFLTETGIASYHDEKAENVLWFNR